MTDKLSHLLDNLLSFHITADLLSRDFVQQALLAAALLALAVDVRLIKEIHRGKLLVSAGVNDVISLDNKVIGRGKWEGAVPSGGHTLKVSSAGMANYQSEVVIQDNQTRRVDVGHPLDVRGGWRTADR